MGRNYRNCSRIGGFRLAFDAAELNANPVDEAWRKRIQALRVANYVAGGAYGVAGKYGELHMVIHCYRRALAIDSSSQAARDGLEKILDEVLPERLADAEARKQDNWIAPIKQWMQEIAQELTGSAPQAPAK